MNAIEDNEFTRGWKAMADLIPRPEAILAVSAHWYTDGTRVSDAPNPETVYDMYGFPDALYQVKYPAPGSPATARRVQELLGERARVDNSWGFDHGAWSVLHAMYPKADVPVTMLSVDAKASPEEHFEFGRKLSVLRDEGVTIFTSGDVVHNLRMIDFENPSGYPWAAEFDRFIRERIEARDFQAVVNYRQAGKPAELSVPTPDHFFPLLYALGAARPDDLVSVHNEACTMGSLSMTSYIFR